jgi:hypothetical protein
MPLTPPDAAVVARDGALPGLALLLDPDRLAATLQAALPMVEVAGLEITYLRYKPATSCLAGLELRTPAGRVTLAAKAFKPNRYAVERQRPVSRKLASPLGPVVLPLDDHAVLCRLLPYDRDLRALPRLVDAEHRRALLAKLVPGLARLDWRMLRHKPGRRHIGLLHDGLRPCALIKLYTPGHYAQALRGARFGDAVGGPALLAHSDRHHLLVSTWQPGVTLAEHPPLAASMPADMKAAAAALAAVHRHGPADLPHRTIADEIAAFRQPAAALAWLVPSLAERAARLTSAVAAQLQSAIGLVGPLHGDFSADQVVLSDDGVRLIDWDRATLGPAALDVGTFLARLEAEALLDEGAHPAAAIESFTDGYASAAGRRLVDHRPWIAAALLRLLGEPFRRRLPDWPGRTEALLDRVAELAAAATPRRRQPLAERA